MSSLDRSHSSSSSHREGSWRNSRHAHRRWCRRHCEKQGERKCDATWWNENRMKLRWDMTRWNETWQNKVKTDGINRGNEWDEIKWECTQYTQRNLPFLRHNKNCLSIIIISTDFFPPTDAHLFTSSLAGHHPFAPCSGYEPRGNRFQTNRRRSRSHGEEQEAVHASSSRYF